MLGNVESQDPEGSCSVHLSRHAMLITAGNEIGSHVPYCPGGRDGNAGVRGARRQDPLSPWKLRETYDTVMVLSWIFAFSRLIRLQVRDSVALR